MRKLFTIIFLAVVSFATQAQSTYHQPCADLFISQYIEPNTVGTGLTGSKAVQIYNPTSAAINMSGYVLGVAFNNCGTVHNFSLPPLNIASHGVYVIISGATVGTVDSVLNLAADTAWSNLIFNGNDAIYLINPSNDTLDIFGVMCLNPTTGFTLGNTTQLTADITLVRKPFVQNGERNWAISENQWDIYPTNTFNLMGSHYMYPCGFHPTVSFLAASDSVLNSTVNHHIPLKLQYPNGDTTFVTVNVVAGGTGVSGVDYSYNTQVLAFMPWDSTVGNVEYLNDTIHIIHNVASTSNKTVFFRLGNITNASSVVDTTTGYHTLYILTPNVAPTINFMIPTYRAVNENVGTILLPVLLSVVPTSAYAVTVAVNLAASTTSPADYVFNTQTINFPIGKQKDTVAFTVINECSIKGLKTAVLHLYNPTNGALLGTDSLMDIAIQHNDSLPQINFPVSQSVIESIGNDSIPVHLSHRYCDTVVMYYVIDTAISTTIYGADYNAIAVHDSIIFYPGDSLKFITLHVIDDTIQEPTESIIITLSTKNDSGIVRNVGNTQVLIIDNDGPPVYYFKTPLALTVNQTNTTYQIPVIDHGGAGTQPYTVNISVDAANTTATLGSDFTFTNQTITFPYAKDTVFIPITLIKHCQFEPLTKIVLKLFNPVNGSIGIDSIYTINIKAHDTLPTAYVVAATDSIIESGGNAFITVGLNRAYCDTVKVIVNLTNGTAMAGSDYNNAGYPDTLIFLPNATTPQTVYVPIINDTIYENTEAFNYSLTSLMNCTAINPAKDSITIIDDDPSPFHPVVEFQNAAASWFENAGTVLIPITIVNSNHSPTSITATVLAGSAILGTDYTTTSPKTFTFPANSSTTLYDTVHIINHMIAAPSKSFVILLTNPTNNATIGLNTTFTGTIIYNDTVFIPTIQFVKTGITVNERAGTISLPITIAHPNANPISFSYSLAGSAILNQNYSVVTTSPVSVVGTVANTNIQLHIIHDFIVTPTKNIVITLSPNSNCTLGNILSTTVYILNVDSTVSPSGIGNVINNSINVYPNPVDANEVLKIAGAVDNTVFELYNVLGEKIFADKIYNQQINLSKATSLYSGIYFYKLIAAQGIVKEGKLVVK